ncbi:MAG: cation:proton antiporter [Burkholderiales bacterium]|nr:cation:proton antiporter [Opitutaceae bacterium]
MHPIEILVFLILLFMGVPDLCRWLRRPALAYPIFVVGGLVFAPFATPELRIALEQIGQLGFLLLLFEVGLEIELPRFAIFRPVLMRSLGWALLQYPVILCLAHFVGLGLAGGVIACAALTGCSVGMGYAAWKSYPNLDDASREKILHTMLALEIAAIVLLSGETALYTRGLHPLVLLTLAGVGVVIYLISRFARRIEKVFELILQNTTHWRMHMIVLAVFVVCALGQRFGLSSTKTAFFLGLFMSRIHHDGRDLEEFIAPISRGFLIPVFFFALGIQIDWSFLFSSVGLIALGTAALLLGWRMVIHRRILPTGGGERGFLLLCPNLTIAALASQILIDGEHANAAAPAWIVLTGLFMTVAAVLLLPRPPEDAAPANQGISNE